MRVVKEITKNDIRITIFSWNNKYLLKFEQGMIEQTFKVNEMDIGSEEGLSIFLSEDFLSAVQKRFDEMHHSLRNQLENL
ncbi:MAG: hypothetical protein WD426_10495 [Anditalea sp.]